MVDHACVLSIRLYAVYITILGNSIQYFLVIYRLLTATILRPDALWRMNRLQGRKMHRCNGVEEEDPVRMRIWMALVIPRTNRLCYLSKAC
jgi:hypothetical protein